MTYEEHAINVKRIVFVILTIVVVGSLVLSFLGNANESRQARGSAYRLQEAIDNVYTHAFELNDPNYAELVNITLPQGSPIKAGVLVDDPKWLIWSGYKPEEIHVLEETEDVFAPHRGVACDNLCMAFAERKDRLEITLKGSARLHKLWLLSPCKASVKVYYDNAANDIKLTFVDNLDPDNEHNFCCSKNEDVALGHDWPEKGGAFQNQCFKD